MIRVAISPRLAAMIFLNGEEGASLLTAAVLLNRSQLTAVGRNHWLLVARTAPREKAARNIFVSGQKASVNKEGEMTFSGYDARTTCCATAAVLGKMKEVKGLKIQDQLGLRSLGEKLEAGGWVKANRTLGAQLQVFVA